MTRIMKHLSVLSVCVLLGASGTVLAQNSTMKLESETWDFGSIEEEAGPVSHTFEFTNTGDKPFVIESVTTTCGCTTPKYTREPVMPDKKGSIEITYNPEVRPGSFDRKITVISNGRTNRNTITIRGEVKPRPRTVEDDFPVNVGEGVLASRTSPALGYVARGTAKSVTVNLYNNSPQEITLGIVYENRSPGFKASFSIPVVKPKEGTVLTATYDLKNADMWGVLSSKFFITVNGAKARTPFIVTGIAIDDFSQMSREQLAEAPKSELPSQYYNFGDVRKGVEKSRAFTFTNQGQNDLLIRQVDGNDLITTDLKNGTVIRSGQSKTFNVTLKTEDQPAGKYMQSLVIITNDPQRPMREIRLAATIL